MLHSGMVHGPGGANSGSAAGMSRGVPIPSAKPYAVMEFEGLLATALSNQSLEALKDFPGGLQRPHQLHHSTPPALPLAPPAETLAQWKRSRGMGRVPTEIRTSPHHLPKSASDGGLLRRAYLDVTQPQFSNELSPDTQAPPRHRQQHDRLHQSNALPAAHTHGGFIQANIRSPTSTNLRTSSPWSSVAVSHLVSPRLLKQVPPSNIQPDLLPRHHHGIHDKPHSETHPDLEPRAQDHRAHAPLLNELPRPGVSNTPKKLAVHSVSLMSHTPLDTTATSSFIKSPRAPSDNPSASNVSLSINTTGSSSSPGSLFSSPPSHLNFGGNSNNLNGVTNGSAGPVSYFAHSPFADTGSGNTSATLSDGPLPIADLLQKPGPNLIKPIACKPSQGASSTSSPSGNAPHRGSSESDGKGLGGQFPRAPPLQPPLSSRLHTARLGSSADPLSPDDTAGGNNLCRVSGAFGKLKDSFPNETRLTSFLGPSGSGNAFNLSSPQTGQPSPSSMLTTQQADSTNSIYKNITPVGASNALQGQQHQSPGDPNTSYSSFTGEFPHSDAVCAPQTVVPIMAPSSHQPYHGQQQQQQQQQRVPVVSGEATTVLQTPSPSDSGVGEHEAILREKDAEINTLREVMDRNERAIFQVYEERRHVWQNDTRKLQDEYERKLKVQSRKSYKTEQVLSLQVYKLQQEQKSLQEDKVKVTQELDALKQRLEEEQAEVSNLRKQLGLVSPSSKAVAPSAATGLGERPTSLEKTDFNLVQSSPASTGKNASSPAADEQQEDRSSEGSPQSLQREIVSKNKELIQLRSKLANFEADLSKANKELSEKAREISSCNDKVKSLQEELHRAKNPPLLTETGCQTHAVASEVVTSENLQRPSLLGKQERTIDELQEETLRLRAHIEELKAQQEEERKQWLDEKNKVVRYQKQLQLNYVQMQRKNTTLETEVQQLTLELENRDMKLTALNGEESVC